MAVCTTCLQGSITIRADHECSGYRPLAPGDVIHGFAHGAFGRDHAGCVRVEAVGPDWIVARDPDERWRGPVFAAGRGPLELCIRARNEPCTVDDQCPLRQVEPPLTTYGEKS